MSSNSAVQLPLRRESSVNSTTSQDSHRKIPSFLSSMALTLPMAADDEYRAEQNDIERAYEADMCYACTGIDPPASFPPKPLIARGTFSRVTSRTWGRNRWWFGRVLNPRSSQMQFWSQFFLWTSVVSIALDPIFLYAFTGDNSGVCLEQNRQFLAIATALRSLFDAAAAVHLFMNLKTAYVPESSMAVGRGDLVTDPRLIFVHYTKIGGRFWLDVAACFPLIQILVWGILPTDPSSSSVLAMLSVLMQLLPKIWKVFSQFRASQLVNGVLFEAPWGGFVLNLGAYLIAAHLFGSIWYLLATARFSSCLSQSCHQSGSTSCHSTAISCPSRGQLPPGTLSWTQNATLTCAANQGLPDSFDFGIYSPAVQVVISSDFSEKIMMGFFFGLMTLSSFGNALQPTARLSETSFSALVIISGLLLFVLLIGNIQVFLQSLWRGSSSLQQRTQSLEWWMRRRQLPAGIRQRVRRQQRQSFVAERGDREEDLLVSLPDSLRRDVKRHLCLPLVNRVPLFADLEEVVLDSICDRLKPVLFIENMVLVREGEPIGQMLFIIRGKMQSNHDIGNGRISTCVLGENNFCGEELLTWSFRNDMESNRLPLCAATLTTLTTLEAFALSAEDLRYVMSHFGRALGSRRMRGLIRYYSPNWRTWAAVSIQLAWRWYKARKAARAAEGGSEERRSLIHSSVTLCDEARGQGRNEELMRLFAAILTAPKPPC